MMNKVIAFSCLIVFLSFGNSNLHAKWWIFGQSNDEVATSYIYLNDIAYDELGREVTLYRDALPGGRVVLKGRGHAGKNRIGAVQISIDGGEEWQRARVANDGSFQFGFKPDSGETYDLAIKIIDTTGKSNDIEETRKTLTISERNIRALIQETLDAMIKAYSFQDARAFMRYVDPDFAGDSVILESAIRKDFTIFDQITMRTTINNIVAGGDKVFASISFNRQVAAARTGEMLEDRGQTEFTFSLTDDRAEVFSMKAPLIFGLSEREDVGTGVVNTSDNQDVIQVERGGEVTKGAVNDDDESDPGGSSGLVLASSGTMNLKDSAGSNTAGFKFASETYVSKLNVSSSDIFMHVNLINPESGALLKNMGACSLSSVSEPPTSGYSNISINADFIGYCFAVQLPGDKYAVVEIKSWVETGGPPFEYTGSFDYKYWE